MIRSSCFSVMILALGWSTAVSANPPETLDVASRVATLLDSKGSVVPAFKSMLPDQASKQLADRILGESPEIWDHLDGELAALLREIFSNEQLVELEAFLGTETGRAWVAHSPDIFAAFQGSSSNPGSFSFRFASIGCVIGIVGPNIDVAKQRTGVTDTGLTDEVYEVIKPVQDGSFLTCDCILRKGLERWPGLTVMQLQLTGEYQEYVQKLLGSGDCPLPVPL